MAFSAHKDEEMMKERFDSEEVRKKKITQVVKWMKKSKHIILFTGAGISTSAGIPDFRGPEGVWTLEAQGRKRTKPTVSTLEVYPTPCHMALVELVNRGIVKYIVSQNCDGLHRRSGIRASNISELHGNVNIELCEDCEKKFYRDYAAVRIKRGRDHFSGRYCECGGRLLESTIDFNQSMPEIPLRKAFAHARKADMCIVMGSSCTVAPACDIPRKVKKRGGKLVIVNLQYTPFKNLASMNVFMKTDDFMKQIMKEYDIQIPVWRKRRRIRVRNRIDPKNGIWRFQVSGLRHDHEVEGEESDFSCLRKIRMDFGDGRSYVTNQEPLELKQHVEFAKKNESLDLTLFWFSHHGEKPVKLKFPISSTDDYECILNMSYELLDPVTNERRRECHWEMDYNKTYENLLRQTGKGGENLKTFSEVARKSQSMDDNFFSFMRFGKGNLKGIQKKIEEFNIRASPRDQISERQIEMLIHGVKDPKLGETNGVLIDQIFVKVLRFWSPKNVFPVLDLLRCYVFNPSFLNVYAKDRKSSVSFKFVELLKSIYEKSGSDPLGYANKTMILRFFCNLVSHKEVIPTEILNQLMVQDDEVGEDADSCKVVLSYDVNLGKKEKDFRMLYSVWLLNYSLFARNWNLERKKLVVVEKLIDRFSRSGDNDQRVEGYIDRACTVLRFQV